MSPHRSLKRTHEGGGKSSGGSARRQRSVESPHPVVSPRKACESPQEGGGDSAKSGKRRLSPAQSPQRTTLSPGRKQELSEIDQILLSIGVDVGQATQTGYGVSESEKSKVRDYASQWDFEDSKRARSLSGLPPASISKAVQAEGVQCNARDRSTQTSHGKNNKSVCVQAFEEDPWAGLLSRQEVCDMIKIDNLVGLGYKERPQARYEDHSVTSKRLIMDGVVYQVIILKERYVEEQAVTQVIEKP